MSETLAVVPTYLTQPKDLAVFLEMAESLRRTEPELDLLVIDDGSPAQPLVDEIVDAGERMSFDVECKQANEGFAKTVNVGLRRALDTGRNAVLVNADIEFVDDGWCERMERQTRQNEEERLASIVGALLLYPTGLIQHAGIYFSLLHRVFEHIYKFAPADLPEAQDARTCPVTGALQFIRHECLEGVGLYDEHFLLGWEDVDYCIRAWQSGRACVYQPTVRAYHHEGMFRFRANPKLQDWQSRSWMYFVSKYRATSFAEFVPSLI